MHNGLEAKESERTVLGSLVMDGMQAMEHCLRMHPEMFYLTSHQTLFREMQRLAGEGQDWNVVSLREVLQDSKLYANVVGSAGANFLPSLTDGIPQRWNPSEHVSRVVEAWRRRRGAQLCETYGARLQDGEGSEILSSLQERVLDVIADGQEQDDPLVAYHTMAEWDAYEAASHSEELSRGLSYGNTSLDTWTYGMQPGEVSVIGARSGVGKSAMMCQAIAANCSAGIAVDCFSLEMERGNVLRRLWAIHSGVEYRKVHKPFLASPDERWAVKQAALRIGDWPLRVHQNPAMPIDEIVARARMSVRRNGCKLVCVDYVQIVEGEGKDDRIRVAAISSKLRKLAKSEKCHVMMLSQLRKVPAEQYSHAPTAADLRETGQIENDAHVIILLHRPWDEERRQISYEADLLIPKCRNGRTGVMKSRFEERGLVFV